MINAGKQSLMDKARNGNLRFKMGKYVGQWQIQGGEGAIFSEDFFNI